MTIHKQLKLSISPNTDATQVFIREIKPKFRLKNPRAVKPSAVFMEVIYGGARSRLTIHKCKVYPYQWSIESQRAFVSSILSDQDNHNNMVANAKIEDTLKRFHIFLRDYCVNIKDIETFHANLKIHMGRPRKKKEKTMDVFEEIRKACINAPGRTDKTINENYIGKGLRALKAFSEHRQANGDPSITDFSMLTASLFNEFYEYLENGFYKKENGENYAVRSLNSIIKYAVDAVKCLPVKFLPEEQ